MADDLHNRPWIVQKYGGTSIGKLLARITTDIVPQYLVTSKVAVVCSALSGTVKSKGTTTLLLDAVRLATTSETSTDQLDLVIDALKASHLDAARIAIHSRIGAESERLEDELQSQISADCEHVRSILRASWTIGELSERTQDRVLATGEKLACRIVAASLRNMGIDAEAVFLDDLEVCRQSCGRDGSRQELHASQWLESVTEAIESQLLKCKGRVPVITGFFGPVPDSLLQSVGHGYSDLCAVLCAVALAAPEVQIWKEVDGIFTADPTKVSSARLLPTVTAEEAAELTFYGSEVVHPLAVEHASVVRILLRLKNVRNPLAAGTIIYPSARTVTLAPASIPDLESRLDTFGNGGSARSNFMVANGYHGDAQYRRTPTAVTAKDGISVINIRSTSRSSPHAALGRVAEGLKRWGITIDLISSSMHSLSLAVTAKSSPLANGLVEEAARELGELGDVTLTKHMSIISVVGHRMRNMVGTAAEIFNALARAQISICLISQGASETNLSFVVKSQDTLRALQVVHTNVLRIPLQSEKEGSMIKGPWLY